MREKSGDGQGLFTPPRRAPGRGRKGSVCAALAAALAVSACTASAVLTPRPKVDVGAQTAAVHVPEKRAEFLPPTGVSVRTASEPAADPPANPPSAATPLEPDAVALAPIPTREREGDPESRKAEPVQVALARPDPKASVPDAKPLTAGYPRLINPLPQKPAMPTDEAACRRELDRLGVTWRDLPPIDDGGACRIDHPVKVSALSGNIRMAPAATLNCRMALTFARWTRNELAPAARLRYLSGIRTIHQGSSYSCRRIAGTNTPSAHSRGNALDIMSIDLDNGREIDVRRPGFFAFRQRSLLNTVRADGCSYFTTVLGPGYNADHKNHFHFDLMPRTGGRHACH